MEYAVPGARVLEQPHRHARAPQITKATVPRAPKLMRMLLGGAFGGVPPVRVRDISDVLTTFLRVRQHGLADALNTPACCGTPVELLIVLLPKSSQTSCQRGSARRVPFWLPQLLGMHNVYCQADSGKGVPVLQATHEQGLKWFNEAVQLVPDEAASPADRRHLEEAAVAASQTPTKSCM